MTAVQPGALLESFTADRPSIAERLAAGKALRRNVSRDAHGAFRKSADRGDPIDPSDHEALDKARARDESASRWSA